VRKNCSPLSCVYGATKHQCLVTSRMVSAVFLMMHFTTLLHYIILLLHFITILLECVMCNHKLGKSAAKETQGNWVISGV